MTKQAVTKIKDAEVPAPVEASETGAILQMIERAARDPNVDIDKMERLFGMRERMMAQTAKAAYLAALAEMQPELPVIEKKGVLKTNEKNAKGEKTGNQVEQSKYAKWEDINEAITPILAKHGFSLTHRIEQPTAERILTTAVLGHKGGHEERTTISLPIENSGSKNNVQGWGSSAQYGKRYTTVAILNITTRGEDDDGKAAGAPAFITDEQASQIRDRIDEVGADIEKFCAYFEIDGIAKIPAQHFQRALDALNAKRRQPT